MSLGLLQWNLRLRGSVLIEAKPGIKGLDRKVDIGRGRDQSVLLDKNERTVPYTEDHFKQFLGTIQPSDLSRYPDQSLLYKKLAEFYEINEENLLLTAGADSGLKHIFETFVSGGDQVVSVSPSYAMINVYSEMFNATLVSADYKDNLVLNEESLRRHISRSTKIVVVPNPNQPTGTLLPTSLLNGLISWCRSQEVLLIVDEAYIEFSDFPGVMKCATRDNNVLVLRTFSKAWGLAGVRLGFIVGDARLLEQVRKVKSLLEINVFALKAACYLIDHYHLVKEYIEEVKESRQALVNELRVIGLETIASCTNFIHFRPPEGYSPTDCASHLLNRGIRVRVAGETASVLDGCVRVTIGPRLQMMELVKELSLLFNKT